MTHLLRTAWLVVPLLLLLVIGRTSYGDDPLSQRAVAILEQHCIRCHNEEKTRGGLDLTTREMALAGGATSDALVPPHLEQSGLYLRAKTGAMPPDRDGRKLAAAEVATLAAWIQAGANWPVKGTKNENQAANEILIPQAPSSSDCRQEHLPRRRRWRKW